MILASEYLVEEAVYESASSRLRTHVDTPKKQPSSCYRLPLVTGS